MVFNTAHKIKQPLQAETRVISRFAWKPKFIGTQVVWLGFYSVLQGFYYRDYPAKIGEETKGFRVGNWVDLSFKIKGNEL